VDEQWQAPWQYGWEQQPPPPPPWEPPVAPPPAPRRRTRRVALVATALGGALLLGGLLATCGPSTEPTGALVVEPVPTEGPSSAPPESSPSPSPTPSPSAAASTDPDASDSPAPAPRQSSRPRPAKSHRTPPAAVPPQQKPGDSTDVISSLKVCAEAERLGEWPPGSDQARICRSLYGE